MKTALVISDSAPYDSNGRAADLTTRSEFFSERNWSQRVVKVKQPYLLTVLPAILRCCWMAIREDVDIITSLSNPFHLQLIGFVCSTVTQKPWIAEIRDPMVTNPDRESGSVEARLAKIVERLMVEHATAVIWSNGIQMEESYFEQTYPRIDASKFVQLPYKGFPQGEFEEASTDSQNRFTITYAGSFYDGWIEPDAFLDGLARYVKEDCSRKDELAVQFYGDWKSRYDTIVKEHGLETIVAHYDFIPKSELIPILKGSDVLLYIGGDDPDNQLSVPSKIWDYIGAQTPILAVVSPSFRSAELVRENELGVVAEPSDPEKISEAIETLHSDDFDLGSEAYNTYTRERKVANLIEIYELNT